MSKPFGQQAYQLFGDIRLQFDGHEAATDYRRSLDIGNALASVAYQVEGVRYSREVFVSEPAQAIVVHLTDDGGTLDFGLALNSPHARYTVKVEGDTLILRGRVNDSPKDKERGTTPYPASRLEFEARLKVLLADGKLIPEEGGLRVSGATGVTLLLVAGTNFGSC